MKFSSLRPVRFADCDPAGIVFYPQYMVMLNTLVEEWFDDGLHIPYAQLIGARRTGLPTVRLEVDFTAISRHGERLTQTVQVARLGRSSLTLLMEFWGGADELRLRARQVLVCTSLDSHRPIHLPDDVRAALLPYVMDAEPTA
jgi:4-hydroxybenzoyl-CoA thioesterase